jgi:multiple sugar transport system permease protein
MAGSNNLIKKLLCYLVLTLLAGMTILPLVWMIATSLKPPGEVFTFPPQWLPWDPVTGRVAFFWQNYPAAWRAVSVENAFFGLLPKADGFLVFYINSLIVSTVITVGQVFTSSLAAYAFARLWFRGRDQIFLAYLATLMVPAVVTMIPLFALFRIFGLTDSYAALILPGLFSAYGTFMLRQFFISLPRELEEAALIDGASPWQIYRRIILPLSRPALATLGIFVFLHSWNEFMWPLIVINQPGLRTLPIGLSYFQDSYTTDWNLLMAGSVIVLLPVLIVFLLGQRFFIKGIVLSGVKG